jgi:ribonuclease VapC
MVIDTSALIAILRGEPEQQSFRTAIIGADVRLVSAVSKLEASMVAIGSGPAEGAQDIDDLLASLSIQVVPFDEHQANIACDAFARFGKGRHRAALNFGDCAVYALAQAEAEPLLYKGTDFGATDVVVAKLA